MRRPSLTWGIVVAIAIAVAGSGGIHASQAAQLSEPVCERISLEKKGNDFIPSLTMDPWESMRQSAPSYWKVTSSRSGTAEFRGVQEFRGSVSAPDFANLCSLALKNLPTSANYGVRRFDHDQVTTTEVETAKGVITVVNIGATAPIDAWSLQQAVESVAFHVTWTKK